MPKILILISHSNFQVNSTFSTKHKFHRTNNSTNQDNLHRKYNKEMKGGCEKLIVYHMGQRSANIVTINDTNFQGNQSYEFYHCYISGKSIVMPIPLVKCYKIIT